MPMAPNDTPLLPPPRARARADWRWFAYAGFWLATGLLQGLAEWQHYRRAGLPHEWEPFLWELSSVSVIGLLALAVWRLDESLRRPGRTAAARFAGYLAGALAFTLAHTALMFSLRFVVYAVAGVAYQPGSPAQVAFYEGAKDLVTYAVLLAGCHGLRLVRRTEHQSLQVARLEAQLAEARLAHLQSQIQPHFLFNTLNLVSSTMYVDLDRADRVLAELADLLRQAEAAGRRPVHALADELAWVRPFLSIMGQRFGGRLAVRVAVSPEAARCEIPSLLLMGPVENAVTHRVAVSAGDVRVEIAARLDGPWLEIEVRDEAVDDLPGDGRAESGDDMTARDDALGATRLPPGAARGRGTGLANTRARLEAMHGERHEVSLRRESACTVLRLRLPAREAGPAPAAGTPDRPAGRGAST